MSKYGLRFDVINSRAQILQLEAFLLAHSGSYGTERHQPSVLDTCIPGVTEDNRRALAWWEHGPIIADAIIKPLGENRLEVKNFRVKEGMEGRALGAVMMAHVCLEGRDLLAEKGLLSTDIGAMTIQLDTSPPLVPYFERHGFVPIAQAALYTPGHDEVIMQRVVQLH